MEAPEQHPASVPWYRRRRVHIALGLVVAVLTAFWAGQRAADGVRANLDGRLRDAGAGTDAALVTLEAEQLSALRAVAFTQGVGHSLATLRHRDAQPARNADPGERRRADGRHPAPRRTRRARCPLRRRALPGGEPGRDAGDPAGDPERARAARGQVHTARDLPERPDARHDRADPRRLEARRRRARDDAARRRARALLAAGRHRADGVRQERPADRDHGAVRAEGPRPELRPGAVRRRRDGHPVSPRQRPRDARPPRPRPPARRASSARR